MTRIANVILISGVAVAETAIAWLFLGVWYHHLRNLSADQAVEWGVPFQWVTLSVFAIVALAGIMTLFAPRAWRLLAIAAPVGMFWILVFETMSGGGF
jgi:hypothetical protein